MVCDDMPWNDKVHVVNSNHSYLRFVCIPITTNDMHLPVLVCCRHVKTSLCVLQMRDANEHMWEHI